MINTEDYKKYINYPLSTEEIKQLYPTNIKLYNELKNINNLDDILINNSCTILYLDTAQYGHYCCVKKYENNYYFFDPYGEKIDKYNHYDNGKKIKSNYLKKLFLKKYKEGYNIFYNEHPLQHHSLEIATCGYWCISFIKLKELNENQFLKYIKRLSNKYKISKDLSAVIIALNY